MSKPFGVPKHLPSLCMRTSGAKLLWSLNFAPRSHTGAHLNINTVLSDALYGPNVLCNHCHLGFTAWQGNVLPIALGWGVCPGPQSGDNSVLSPVMRYTARDVVLAVAPMCRTRLCPTWFRHFGGPNP